jgi:hypothetical protein
VAESITADIREKAGMEPLGQVLKTAPSSSFMVGRLQSKYPSPVHFYPDKVSYVFHHPFQSKEIAMDMYFRDMSSAQVSGTTFQFKISRPLHEYISDYDHSDPSHVIALALSSKTDSDWVRCEILPKIGR